MTDSPDLAERQRLHTPDVDRERFSRAAFRASVGAVRSAGAERRHWTSRLLHSFGAIAATAVAGILSAICVVAWAIVGFVDDFPRWWEIALYSTTGSVTFVMVFVIQHTQERQISAVQRKLDELIRASAHADHTLIAVEGTDDLHLQALAELNVVDRQRASDTEPDVATNSS